MFGYVSWKLGVQGVLVRAMALRMVSILRVQATTPAAAQPSRPARSGDTSCVRRLERSQARSRNPASPSKRMG